MLKRRLRLSLSLLFFVTLNGCSSASENGEPPWAPYNSSMEIEEVTMKPSKDMDEIHFYVPKAYFSRVGNPFGGKAKLLSIESGLPGLEPRKAEFRFPSNLSQDDYKVYQFKWKNGITIDISNTTLNDRFWDNLKSFLGAKYQHRSDNIYGLVAYLQSMHGRDCFSKTMPNKELAGKCYPRIKEHYLNTSSDRGSNVYINCEREELFYTRCIAEASMSGLEISYSFRRTELFRWKEFDSGVRKLIRAFQTQFDQVETSCGRKRNCDQFD